MAALKSFIPFRFILFLSALIRRSEYYVSHRLEGWLLGTITDLSCRALHGRSLPRRLFRGSGSLLLSYSFREI